MDDDATQPSTQAVELQHRTTVESDPTILMVLHPASPAANDAVWYLADRVPHMVKPHATDNLPGDICLRYTLPPKNVEAGYTFGRNPYKCDVPLGQQSASRRVSNVHFRIFINSNGVVMLEDCSTNGTWVDNVCLAAPRTNPPGRDGQNNRRRILTNSSLILLALGPEVDELKFIVGMKSINKVGWRMVSPVFNRGGMAPPKIAAGNAGKHDEVVAPSADTDDDLYALPDGWGGDNGPYQSMSGFIGKGAFAVVRKITHKETGDQYAVKIINKRAFAGMDDIKRNGKARKLGVLKEVEIMEQLNHPNIVQYFECRETQKQIYIRMEYVPKGDLNDYLKMNGRMEEGIAREATRQLMSALEYVHNLGISHRDIKPDNILVKCLDPIEVKLSDFGLAKMIQNDDTFLKTFCGTMLYLAPEVFPQTSNAPMSPHAIRNGRPRELRRYNQACDMWSLGCVLFVLLSGVVPFNGENQDDIQRRISKGRFDVERLREAEVSDNAIDFLSRLLVVDPNNRIMEREALEHPWLQEGLIENKPEFTEEEFVLVNALKEEINDEEPKAGLAKAIDEWEVVKDEIQAGADDRQIGLEGTSPNQLATPVIEHAPSATSPAQIDVTADVAPDDDEDGIKDEDGDVEIEGSQEQFDRRQRQYLNLTLSQQRRPPMASRQQPQSQHAPPQAPPTLQVAGTPLQSQPPHSPAQAEAADQLLHAAGQGRALSPALSIHDSFGESALESNDFAVGLSQYADPMFDMLPRGQADGHSIKGSSGAMGDSQYHDGDEDEPSEESTDSSRPSSSSSSHSKTYSHAISATSSRALKQRNSRRMSGTDGKSLAGMRTMVNNLQVGSTGPSVLHRQRSGVFSEGGRVTKRKKSTSGFNGNDETTAAKVYEAAMATIESGGTGSQDPASQQVPASDYGAYLDIDDNHDGAAAPSSYNQPRNDAHVSLSNSQPITAVNSNHARDGNPVRPLWGRLVPLRDSMPHNIIPLVDQQVSYGRASVCTCVVTDIRVSKLHFAVKLTEEVMQPSAVFNQLDWVPQKDMKAWIKINGSNGVTINGRKMPKDNTVRLFDGDELIVFKERSEYLGFRVELMIGDHTRTEEDVLREREYDNRRWLDMVPSRSPTKAALGISAF